MASSREEGSKAVRLVIYFRKKAELSTEQFHEYWSGDHAAVFLSTKIAQTNVLKYTQYHLPRAANNKVAEMGLPTLDYDGAAELIGKDLDSLMAIFNDPEYLDKVVPDEMKFIDKETGRAVVGYDEVKSDHS